jgi:carboxylesterase type B
MGGSGPMMGIVVDGWVIQEQPAKIFAEGREQKVGLMIGNNSQEFQGMMGMMGGRGATPPADIRQMISQRYGPLTDCIIGVSKSLPKAFNSAVRKTDFDKSARSDAFR